MILQGNRITRTENCPSATLFKTNLIFPGQESNPVLCSDRQAKNRLNHSTNSKNDIHLHDAQKDFGS